MKRIYFLLALACFSLVTFAEGPDFQDGNLYYKIVKGDCYVYGLAKSVGRKLIVPSTASVQGRTFTVTGVMAKHSYGVYPFDGIPCMYPGVREIVLPKTVTYIGSQAFAGDSIESIVMDGVRTIDEDAFAGCQYLKKVSCKNVVELIRGCFRGCVSLNEMIIPPTCELIEPYAFNVCGASTNDFTFIIEDSETPLVCRDRFLETFGKKLYIGRTLSIGTDKENKRKYYLGFSDDIYYFKDVDFGDNVLEMPPIAYSKRNRSEYSYYQFQHLTIGASIKKVPDFSNDDCDIKSIHLVSSNPPEVNGKFSNRTYLYCKLYVPQGSLNAYKNAPVWKEFFNIEEYDNQRTTALRVQKEKREAEEAMKIIEKERALRESQTKRGALGKNLKWELYKGTLTIFGQGEMINVDSRNVMPWIQYRDSIRSLKITDGITSIGNSTFFGCKGLKELNIPNSVTSIGHSAFYGCSGLRKMTIPNSVISIGNSAFSGCKGLIELNIPNSVTSIGNNAFYGCSNLTSVTIPNSVTSIGDGAFLGCSKLTTMTIPNSVTSIGENVFSGCFSLLRINVSASNANYSSINGVLFNKNQTVIIRCPEAKQNAYTIPNNVTSISNYAFSGCKGLIELNIPNSVTSIGNNAFYGCSNLTSVTIPNSVTSISNNAFSGCKSLISVTIPNSVTSIGNNAFYDCSSLTSVTIPNSVTSIEDGAFLDCSKLTTMTIPNNVTSISNNAFSGCKSLISVTIPNGVTSFGNNAFYDCSSLTSVTIPNSVTSIGDGAFLGCSKLTTVTIPNKVTSISNYAFSGCESLISVTMPKSVTSIGHRAFAGCMNLKNVAIPSSVTNIDQYAFVGCRELSITLPKIFKDKLDLSSCKKVKYKK